MKTIKHTLIAAVVLSTVSAGFVGCKKGENDPFLSFKSRKSRVAGDWTISEGSGTSVDASSNSSTTWTISGGTKSTTVTSGSSSVTSTSTISMSLTIEKDGTWKSTTTETGSGWSMTDNSSGTWNWTGGVGELKNKSQIAMATLSSTSSQTIGSSTTTSSWTATGSSAPTSIWDIDQLKSKEMIVKWEGNDSSGDSDKGSYTFVQ